MSRGCFVAWPLDPGAADAARTTVRDELADAAGRGVNPLLQDAGAATVSVFLRRPESDAPQLAWFVEHDDREAWADPAATIRDQSPVFDRLDSVLADGRPTVVAVSATDATEIVHAALPGRPVAFADQTDALSVVCSGNDSTVSRPEVVPLVLDVRGGIGSVLARGLTWLVVRTPAWLEAKFEAASLDVMEAEGMYTETLLLSRDPDGYRVWWYMESGGMDDVAEAYYDSDSRIARVSEHVLGWMLERPGRVLEHPVEATEFELLAHAVDPGRA